MKQCRFCNNEISFYGGDTCSECEEKLNKKVDNNLSYLQNITDKIDIKDRDTFRAYLIGSLSVYVDKEIWEKCCKTALEIHQDVKKERIKQNA